MSTYLKIITALLAVFIFYYAFLNYSSELKSFLTPKPVGKNNLKETFKAWMVQYNRTYTSKKEFHERYEIFSQNYEKISQLNLRPNQTHVLTLNNFADFYPHEVSKYTKGHQHGDIIQAAHPMILEMDISSLPSSIDWRTKNAVTPIKDQGHCGACWAFSTIVGLEGLHAIKTNNLTNFSEQNLIDCSTNGPNSGCAGGDPEAGYDYIRLVGLEETALYPFTGLDAKCGSNLSLPHYKIKNFTQVTPNDNDQLAAAVALQPVSICIDGDNTDFLYYGGGIFNSSMCTTNLGHCLAIVGYDSENGVDYWIVKNSYGVTWGEQGYIRMYKQQGTGPGICGITLEAVLPISL